jgi:hypothetical protein
MRISRGIGGIHGRRIHAVVSIASVSTTLGSRSEAMARKRATGAGRSPEGSDPCVIIEHLDVRFGCWS